MKTVVIDTNVLIAAIRSRNGASFKLLSMIGTGVFKTVVSVPLVIEYEYAALKTAAQVSLDAKEIRAILDYVCKVSKHQEIFFLWRPILRDPSDDMILEVAVASSADGVVTFNKKDFKQADSVNVSVWTPLEFLNNEELL